MVNKARMNQLRCRIADCGAKVTGYCFQCSTKNYIHKLHQPFTTGY
jgi:hypothetical protein